MSIETHEEITLEAYERERTQRLSDFKFFLQEANKTNSIPALLNLVTKTYEKQLPGCCFCLWLLDTEKSKMCQLLSSRKSTCTFDFPQILDARTEPLAQWFSRTESGTFRSQSRNASLGEISCGTHDYSRFIPLPSTNGPPLLLTICSPEEFPARREQFFETLTTAVQQSIDRVRLFVEMEILRRISNLAIQTGSLKEFLEDVIPGIADAFDAKGCSIFVYDDLRSKLVLGATTKLHAPDGKPLDYVEYELGEGLTGWIGKYRKVTRIFNTKEESELRQIDPSGELVIATKSLDGPADSDTNEPRQFLGLPILLRSPETDKQKLIGVLRLHKKQYGVAFFPHDEGLGRVVCDALAPAIERWSLSEKEASLTRSLFTTMNAIHSADERDVILTTIVQEAKQLFGADAASILLREKGGDVLRVVAEAGEIQKSLIDLNIPISEGLVGYAIRNRKTVVAEDDVYTEQTIERGMKLWLDVVSKHKIPVVLFDTAEKGEKRCLLKNTSSDQIGILHASQIKEIDRYATRKGIKVLWAGGITLRQTLTFGQLNVFGIYVTTAAAVQRPIEELTRKDPSLAFERRVTFAGVRNAKLLLESGFLITRLRELGKSECAANLEDMALQFLDELETRTRLDEDTTTERRLHRLAVKAWTAHCEAIGLAISK